jgi:hypothetical protein
MRFFQLIDGKAFACLAGYLLAHLPALVCLWLGGSGVEAMVKKSKAALTKAENVGLGPARKCHVIRDGIHIQAMRNMGEKTAV